MKFYGGIDPGASGGAAFLGENGKRITAFKMPSTPYELFSLLRRFRKAEFIYLEKVNAMPGQGVVSTFKFGVSYGIIQGILAGLSIPYDFVTPHTWQKKLGCLTGGNKNITKAKAQSLFPKAETDVRGITHAVADAMLLAYYCYLEKNGKNV